MINKEITFIVTSDPNNGASGVTSDGAQFNVQLETPVVIPKESKNITVSCETASIWWVVPNVITGVNDKFYLDDNGTPRNITIEQGLYDLTNLGAAINTQIVNSGGADGLITFTPDTSTQKVVITATAATQTIDFTQPDTFRDILGFNSQTLGPNVGAPFSWIAPNTAAFNVVNYFLIGSSLLQSGLRFNNVFNKIIAQVLIDVSPGSQITYSPFNPPKSNAPHLKGAKITNMTFRLMDENGLNVNTGGEYWSARIAIRYDMPIDLAE